jgi:hypothetical protein
MQINITRVIQVLPRVTNKYSSATKIVRLPTYEFMSISSI